MVRLMKRAVALPRISRLSPAVALAVVLASLTPPSLAQRQPVEAKRGMVASASTIASEVGVEILRKGGNAVDAAVATGLALAVTYPRAGNLGGGGFLLLRLADGRTTAIDFREQAPGGATRDMYLDADGNVAAGRSTVGHLASGVPGTVAGFALALEKYGSGKISWADVVAPAQRLAANGFTVSPALARDLRASEKLLGPFADSKRIFLRDGRFYEAGESFVQADLARTLDRLRTDGPRAFYEGETARLIAAEMAKHGGLITEADLKAYRAVEREPVRGSYRGHEILTMPPPSSGGIALLQIFGMIEPYDVAAMGHNSAAKIHLFTEAMRRAFRDRAEFLGDPDFVNVPAAGLLARDYIQGLMTNFNPERATPSEGLAPGKPAGWTPLVNATPPAHLARETTETTHFSVVDADGNVASCTYTLNGLFGSGVTAAGTGVLLNNEMDDFTAKVGVRNMYGLIQSEANAIAPGKRPLSSMTPTIVLKDGKPFLVTGSPGGPTIINTTLLIISNVIDHAMRVTQAVDAPRFHHQWQPDVINHEPFLTSADTMALLKARGHTLATRRLYPNDPEAAGRYYGDGETILVDPTTGHLLGASDSRSPDAGAVGY
jgi:gamma-glutamyltranspeptidase/glutathione hydrolase